MSIIEALMPAHSALTKNIPATKGRGSNTPCIRNSPAMMTIIGVILKNDRWESDRELLLEMDVDTRLSWLVGNIGAIVNTVNPANREQAVCRVAAVAFAWLYDEIGRMPEVIEAIATERLRQRQLFAAGKLSFAMSSTIVGCPRKLRVLAEEVGELAEAIDDMERHPRSKSVRAHFREELVQVAAVAVAWLESF